MDFYKIDKINLDHFLCAKFAMLERMKQPARITWNYLRGFIEADGSFHFFSSGKPGGCEIRFGQKANRTLLAMISAFLSSEGFTHCLDPETPRTSSNKGRAPVLRVQGRLQCARFLKLMRENSTDNFLFLGVKARTFMLFELIVSTTKYTPAQFIGLRMSMHKSHRNEPDLLPSSNMRTREQREADWDLPPGESYRSTEHLIQPIDENYDNFQAEIREGIQNKTLNVSGEFMAGVMDGDSNIFVRPLIPGPASNYRNTFNWESRGFVIYSDGRSKLVLEALAYMLNSNSRPNAHGSDGVIGSHTIVMGTRASYEAFKEKVAPYMCGEYKIQQYQVLESFYTLLDKKMLRDYDAVVWMINKIYDLVERQTKGRARASNRQQMLEAARMFYGSFDN